MDGLGSPKKSAAQRSWLASDDSDNVHGFTLFVGGGMTLYSGSETGG